MKSFTQIATEVIRETFPRESNIDSEVKRLNRYFTKFVSIMGGDIKELKDEKSRMYFSEEEEPFLKVILQQLATEKGVAFDITKRKEPVGSLDEMHDLIQMMIDAMSEDGMTDAEAQALVNWLDMIFQFSFYVTIEHCHQLVDAIAINLLPQPYTHSMMHIQRFYETLKKSFAETTVYSAMMLGELGEFIRNAMLHSEEDELSDLYGDVDDPIKAEYCQRDTNAVAFLKANPEIRHYVEKRTGATIEDIWKLNNCPQVKKDVE